MVEFLNFLNQFYDLIQKQINIFLEFISLIEREEKAIEIYNMAEIEKTVILKDQCSQIAKNVEEKRIILLKKIFYMMAFDSRNLKLSLPLFKTVFSTYKENVKSLVDRDIYEKLNNFEEKFILLSSEYESLFRKFSGRIYRNQEILKKMIKHVHLSIGLFQSEAVINMNYDALGKSQANLAKGNKFSSVRVKA